MQVKVFEADDMRSALAQVKKTLGPQAMILSSRNIRRNKFGIPGKTGIEVTAAVEGADSSPSKNDDAPIPSPTEADSAPKSTATYNRRGDFQAALAEIQPPETQGAASQSETDRPGPAKPAAGKSKTTESDNLMFEELRQMKQSFEALAQQFSEVKGQWIRQFFESAEANGIAASPVLTELKERGLGAEALQLFSETMAERVDSTAPEALEAAMAQFISEHIAMNNPLSAKTAKRLAFIGPTGVGKTTTIAKVAANYMLNGGKNVALATIDNYRIAAVEQLKIYGRIMDVPVEVARSPEQLQAVFERHADKELILVDTAGTSPRDDSSRQELAAFLPPSLGIENHLVLSATTRQSDMYTAINRFSRIPLSGMVLTKLDECDLPGRIVDACLRAGQPLCFLTNGQKVPEDLLRPDARKLAAMIVAGNEDW
ncbi:MAG: flagellar biosynthesis protein FlhF [Thermodesulfobacteriota bacterium]